VKGQEAATERLRDLGAAISGAQRSQEERRARFQRIAGRKANGTAPVAVSAWQLFPTPAAVADRMMDAAALSPGMLVLEPSAGTGNLVRSALARGVRPEDVRACEVSGQVADEFARDFPAVRLFLGDFLERGTQEIGGPFDRVLMNPPFHRGEDARHIVHAAGMLAPGGLLVALCYDGRAFREELEEWCATAERLPAGSFRECGTRAEVVMVTIAAGAAGSESA
jgi:phospholipid N-methyltransferase